MHPATTSTSAAAGGVVGVGAPRAARSAPAPTGLGQAVEALGTLLSQSPEQLDALDPDQLREQVQVLRRLEGLAVTAMASRVAALQRAGAIRGDGAPSTTAWVAAATGTSRRSAAQRARLATDLDTMPATRRALADGDISSESADVVVRAARDGRLGTPEEVQAALLPVARAETPERLRAEVARRTQEVDGASLARDEARQHAQRRVSLVPREDGMVRLDGLLTGIVGEKARTLLDAFETADPQGTDPDARRRPDQRLADAFEALVDVALDHGPTPTAGGVARPHLSVVVDLATFDADLTEPDDPDRPMAPDHPRWADLPAGETAWGRTLSPQAVRMLCCDAGVSRIVTDGTSQVLDVGRLTQTWSAPQRRAIAVRDRACRGPACGRPLAWTHVHHIQWWRHDGPTDVDNGVALCPACHRLVHDRGWTVELDRATAAVTWTSPTGREVVTHPRPPT